MTWSSGRRTPNSGASRRLVLTICGWPSWTSSPSVTDDPGRIVPGCSPDGEASHGSSQASGGFTDGCESAAGHRMADAGLESSGGDDHHHAAVGPVVRDVATVVDGGVPGHPRVRGAGAPGAE